MCPEVRLEETASSGQEPERLARSLQPVPGPGGQVKTVLLSFLSHQLASVSVGLTEEGLCLHRNSLVT